MPPFDPAPAGPFRVEATRVLSAGLGVRVRRVWLVIPLLVLAAACVPSPQPVARASSISNTNPTPVVSTLPAMVDLSAPPTLAEYVYTVLAYQGDQQAVLWLIHDTFGDRPDLEHCFASGPPTGAPNGDGIVSRESGYSTWSKNPGSDASGLTQQIGHADVYAGLNLPYDPFNPLYNLRVARSMAETHAGLVSGWQPLPPACR